MGPFLRGLRRGTHCGMLANRSQIGELVRPPFATTDRVGVFCRKTLQSPLGANYAIDEPGKLGYLVFHNPGIAE